jgi:hypothetical protein
MLKSDGTVGSVGSTGDGVSSDWEVDNVKRKAIECLERGDPAAASAMLRSALTPFSTPQREKDLLQPSLTLLHLLAKAESALGHPATVVEVCDTILKIDGKNVKALTRRGLAALALVRSPN